jgi:hypothetical protein
LDDKFVGDLGSSRQICLLSLRFGFELEFEKVFFVPDCRQNCLLLPRPPTNLSQNQQTNLSALSETAGKFVGSLMAKFV